MRALLKWPRASLAVLALFAPGAARAQGAGDSLLVDVPAPAIQSSAQRGPVTPALAPNAGLSAPATPSPGQARNPATPAPPPAQAKAAPAAPKKDEPAAAKTETAPNVEPLAMDGKGPDESALRYYASLQQFQRAETEIRRLKRLYPEWTPPENLYNAPAGGGVDEQPFWDLYTLGRLDQLRADVEKRMSQEPGWQPSADLMDKVRRKEVRNNITDLWKAGKWKDIVDFIKGNVDAAADDTDVDILWTVAEAYAKTKQTPDALNVYKSIMKNNRETSQRLATVQKAMAILRMNDVEQLVAMAKTDSGGKSEIEPIMVDIIRGRIGSFLHDERNEPIVEDELKRFEEFASKDKDPNQPGLVAWYYYKTKVFARSLDWFKLALEKGGDSMIAHGLAHSLRELGLFRDTEEVAYAWREPLINNAILFIDILERDLTKEIPPYIEPERLLRYAQVTMDNAAGEGAQGLAWYAYNSCQFKVAHEWFERAVAWLPKEATVYGYALTLQKLKRTKEFWDVLNRYDGLFPKVIDIIYPDDLYHPPTPCDLMESQAQAQAQAQKKPRQQLANGATVPAPYVPGQPYASAPQPYGATPAPMGSTAYGAAPGYGGAPAGGAPLAQAGMPGYPANPYAPQQPANPYAPPQGQNPYAPQPGVAPAQPGYYQNPQAVYRKEPAIDRKLFPVSVDPQNPLRHNPTGRYMGPQSPVATRAMATPSPFVNEPQLAMAQVVARRVPDVTRMPYERWGYALLPGYNGVNAPTGPHSAEKAPAGTLWTTLQAGDAAATRAGAFDPLRQDINALLQRMQSLPPVPPPTASLTGPWRSPPPYKSREQLEFEGLIAPANTSSGPADLSKTQPMPTGAIPQAANAAPSPMAAQSLPLLASRPAAPRPAPAPQTPASAYADQVPAPEARVTSRAVDALGLKAVEQYNNKQFALALATLDARAQSLPETNDLRLIRAWSLLNLNRIDEGKQVFATLGGVKPALAAGDASSKTRAKK